MTLYCGDCGQENPDGKKFCWRCGCKLGIPVAEEESRNQIEKEYQTTPQTEPIIEKEKEEALDTHSIEEDEEQPEPTFIEENEEESDTTGEIVEREEAEQIEQPFDEGYYNESDPVDEGAIAQRETVPNEKSEPAEIPDSPCDDQSSNCVVVMEPQSAQVPPIGTKIHKKKSTGKVIAATIAVIAIVIIAVVCLLPTNYDVTVDIVGKGQVTGTGTFEEGSIIVLEAKGTDGQEFYQWSDGVTTAKRLVTVDSDIRLTAYFSIFYNLKISQSISDAGDVTGGSHIRAGQNATLTAQPKYGYNFSHWEVNGSYASSSSQYTFKVDSNLTVKAVFEKMKFKVDLTSDNGAAVYISGTTNGYCEYQDNVNVTVQPLTGYSFDGWYQDGTLKSTSKSYTFKVEANTSLKAKISIIHDATFTLQTSTPQVNSDIILLSKYSVEVSSNSWVFKDADTGSIVPITPSTAQPMSKEGVGFKLTTPHKLTVTRTVKYTDGQSAQYSLTFIVDGTVTQSFAWDYTYGYKQTHELMWGLIKWDTDETATKEMTYDLDLSFKDYQNYKDALEIKTYNFVDEGYKKGRIGDVSKMVTYQDPVIKSIASAFLETTSELTDLERAQFTLNFVTAAIKYTSDEESTGYVEYYKYPYETLYSKQGDCEDTAFLFAAIAKAMGYDVIVVQFPGHELAAINVEGASGYGFTLNGKTYYYCETTGDTGYWGIGQLASAYRSLTPTTFTI